MPSSHQHFMDRAIKNAKNGLGQTQTNPLVGACLVENEHIIAEGYHEEYGGLHAEKALLQDVEKIPDDAILYCTLEPCIHHGKTPPCLETILESNVKSVVLAHHDPNPTVNKTGIQALKSSQINLTHPIQKSQYRHLNRAYFYGQRTGFPWIELKLAMSADGFLTTNSGESRWITSQKSRQYGHQLRAQCDAVMVGAETVRTDNPKLTDRETDTTQPEAIIVTTEPKSIPRSHHLVQERPKKTIIVGPADFSTHYYQELVDKGIRILTADLYNGRFDWYQILPRLRSLGVGRILVEGGGNLAASLLNTNFVNELHLFYSEKFFGSGTASVQFESPPEAVDNSHRYPLIETCSFENDVYVRRFNKHRLRKLEIMDFYGLNSHN